MIPAQKSAHTPAVMTPQIVFQCPHCLTRLQVPIHYSGKSGPCPNCSCAITTPSAHLVSDAPPSPPEQKKRQANPLAVVDAEQSGLQRKSFSSADAPMSRSINRGILADNALNRKDIDKKEGREALRIFLIFFAAFIVLGIAAYLFKSLVIGG